MPIWLYGLGVASQVGGGVDPNDFPNVKDWFHRVADWPAVKRAIKVLSKESVRPTKHDDETWSKMFGGKQFHR